MRRGEERREGRRGERGGEERGGERGGEGRRRGEGRGGERGGEERGEEGGEERGEEEREGRRGEEGGEERGGGGGGGEGWGALWLESAVSRTEISASTLLSTLPLPPPPSSVPPSVPPPSSPLPSLPPSLSSVTIQCCEFPDGQICRSGSDYSTSIAGASLLSPSLLGGCAAFRRNPASPRHEPRRKGVLLHAQLLQNRLGMNLMQNSCLQRLSRDPSAGLQNSDVPVLTAEPVAARSFDFNPLGKWIQCVVAGERLPGDLLQALRMAEVRAHAASTRLLSPSVPTVPTVVANFLLVQGQRAVPLTCSPSRTCKPTGGAPAGLQEGPLQACRRGPCRPTGGAPAGLQEGPLQASRRGPCLGLLNGGFWLLLQPR
ncbi:hypothetical protein D4764_14G0001210 [Takifugu flavidus]|uniref:Uncharacterized protein n=1 Tax=Takifugu flavidus TaxID=433684 RepID=A0A5C6P7D5_9TELE|nr:hypothetical protein D4764_14G0001210 [Takifugu flavidus]